MANISEIIERIKKLKECQATIDNYRSIHNCNSKDYDSKLDIALTESLILIQTNIVKLNNAEVNFDYFGDIEKKGK